MRFEVRRPLQRPHSVLMGAGLFGALRGKQEPFPELFPARVEVLGHFVSLGLVFSECGEDGLDLLLSESLFRGIDAPLPLDVTGDPFRVLGDSQKQLSLDPTAGGPKEGHGELGVRVDSQGTDGFVGQLSFQPLEPSRRCSMP